METVTGIKESWVSRLGLFVLFTLCMLVTFVVFSHFKPFLSGAPDVAGRTGLIVLFCCLSRLTHQKEKYASYHPIFILLPHVIPENRYRPLP